MEDMISLYSKIGYECIRFSVKDGGNTEMLREKMKDRITSLQATQVSEVIPDKSSSSRPQYKTEEISSYHKQGKHVTTFPEMYIMPFGVL